MTTINLIKLCVGADSLQDLLGWEKTRGPIYRIHTRNMPKRKDELLEGGSLYWVIKGQILCRRRIVSFEVNEASERPQIWIGLDAENILTEPQPRRLFQGWRYLLPEDAPRDLNPGVSADLPPDMVVALKEAGAW